MDSFTKLVEKLRKNDLPDISMRWAVGLLFLVVVLRIIMTIQLYRDGFESISADDFGRIIEAAKWAKEPHAIWHGPWLPFHTYFFGNLLRVHWDLLWMPRFVTIIFGIVTIVSMYLITKALFNNRLIGFIAALFMSLNPTHLWLSLTPLTELYCHGFVMLAILSFILNLQTNEHNWLLLAGISLAVANGIRFESWVYSAFFSAIVFLKVGKNLLIKKDPLRTVTFDLIVACVPWIFPLLWIVGNYVNTGNPLYFLTFVRNYKLTYYGADSQPGIYVELFTRFDPFLYYLSLIGIAWAWLINGSKRGLHEYLLIVIGSLVIYFWLSGGQIEPLANYIRYVGPFMYLLYPFLSYLLISFVIFIPINKIVRFCLLVSFVLSICVYQIKNSRKIEVDPSSTGVKVGEMIKQIRGNQEGIFHRVIVQRVFWEYLAIQTGGSDDGFIVFDSPLDIEKRTTTSLISIDQQAFVSCVLEFDVKWIVLKDPYLVNIVSQNYNLEPIKTVNDYQFFLLPNNFIDQYNFDENVVCPLGLELFHSAN